MRIEPLSPPWDEATGALLDSMMPAGVPPIALFRVLARNSGLVRAMRGLGRHMLGKELTVSMRAREIVIDRVCARSGCEYEWGVHVAFFADRVGLVHAQVRSLTHGGPTDDCWEREEDRLLIEMVDALAVSPRVGDELWARLGKQFSEEQLLDLLLLVGWYSTISAVALSTEVPLEEGAPRFSDYESSPASAQ